MPMKKTSCCESRRRGLELRGLGQRGRMIVCHNFAPKGIACVCPTPTPSLSFHVCLGPLASACRGVPLSRDQVSLRQAIDRGARVRTQAGTISLVGGAACTDQGHGGVASVERSRRMASQARKFAVAGKRL